MFNFKKLGFCCLVLVCCVLASCKKEVIIDPVSRTIFFIDNQSTKDLYFDLANPSIDIPSGDRILLVDQEIFGDAPILPDDIFSYLDDRPNEVFLFRDSSNIPIEALKLDPNPSLNWIASPEDVNRPSNEFEFTLFVTDDLIN